MTYRLRLSTYVNTILLNKALVVSNKPGQTNKQTLLTYMYNVHEIGKVMIKGGKVR